MFTGIIESLGSIVNIVAQGRNIKFTIRAPFAGELKINDSVSHNGVCLTVVDVKPQTYSVTVIEESLSKTNLGLLKAGDPINLERSMLMNGRIDGHLIQGHIDGTAQCNAIEEKEGSYIFTFCLSPTSASRDSTTTEKEANEVALLVEKGSICINGVSLTVFNVKNHSPLTFSVAIIPHTFSHTTFQYLKQGNPVNIEFDIIGKYVASVMTSRQTSHCQSG